MRYILLFIFPFLYGCGTTVKTLEQDIDKNLDAKTGYLLVGVQTTTDLKSIKISGEETIKLSYQDIKSGSNYILVDLPAGDYEFERVELSNYWRVRMNDEDVSWAFEIVPGKISYVGDLEVINRGFWFINTNVELVNRSSSALQFLEEHYPTITQNRDVAYTGPGNDSFFHYVTSLKKD